MAAIDVEDNLIHHFFGNEFRQLRAALCFRKSCHNFQTERRSLPQPFLKRSRFVLARPLSTK